MNKNPIDLVVPWVNPSDPVWQECHNKFNKAKGDNGKNRTRDIGIFPYFFRGVEQNLPFIRYIHLLLFGPSQIPSWLNVDNPKLKIHYHHDFIPEELLPTFNTFVIEGFYHKIPELSNNFISCNDDFLFTNLCTEEDFFRNDIPVDYDKRSNVVASTPYQERRGAKNNTLFQQALRTSLKIAQELTGKYIVYSNPHTPFGLNKSLIEFCYHKYNDRLMNALSDSKFRREKNFVSWMWRYIRLNTNMFVKDINILKEHAYYELSYEYNETQLKKLLASKKSIVLNDFIPDKRNEVKITKSVTKLLNNKFPVKSSFEK